ncbi:MAG: carboxypeptidase-like regulatory domain-containing protein [Bacteroidia bacterium]
MQGYTVLFLLLVLVSCKTDYEDILLQGVVTDELSGSTIHKAKLGVTIWIYGNSPDESYSEEIFETLTTDSLGKFELKIEAAAFIQVHVSAPGYQDAFENINIRGKKINLDFALNPDM